MTSPKWVIDPIDTRDWNLQMFWQNALHYSPALSGRIVKLLNAIRDVSPAEIESHGDLDLNNVGLVQDYPAYSEAHIDNDYSIESAALLVFEYMNCKFGDPRRLSREFLNLVRCSGQSPQENGNSGLRSAIKALSRFGAVPEDVWHAHQDKRSPVLFGYGKESEGLVYFRLDAAFWTDHEGDSGNRMLDLVRACLLTGIPVLLTVTVFSDVLAWTSNDKKNHFPLPGRDSFPVGQHPVLAYDFGFEIPELPQISKERMQAAFGGKDIRVPLPAAITQKKPAGGVEVRHFLGSGIGLNGYAIVPDCYFDIGLVRDCWIILKPEWIEVIGR